MTAETKRTERIRAITLHRPWSFAVAHLGKDVENRGWRTNYRGLLAIHGGTKWSNEAASRICEVAGNYPLETAQGIVAVAKLVDCHEAELDSVDGRFFIGCCESSWAMPTGFHWVLADVRPLPEPVLCKGRQGLWRLPEDVERAVWSALAGER